MQTDVIKNTGKVAGTGAIVTGFVGDAFNVVSSAAVFKNSQEEGDHIAVAATKGAIDFAASEAFYGSMAAKGGLAGGFAGSLGMMAVTTGATLAAKHMENTGQKIGRGTENLKGIGSGHFDMTSAGYTMRQRSLNAIRSNGANINSAFGNEARNFWLGL